MFPDTLISPHTTAMLPDTLISPHTTAMLPDTLISPHTTAMFPDTLISPHTTAMFPDTLISPHTTAMLPDTLISPHTTAMFPGVGYEDSSPPGRSPCTTLFILSNHPRWQALCLWFPMSTKQLLLSWQLLALQPSSASPLQPCLPPLCLLIQRCVRVSGVPCMYITRDPCTPTTSNGSVQCA